MAVSMEVATTTFILVHPPTAGKTTSSHFGGVAFATFTKRKTITNGTKPILAPLNPLSYNFSTVRNLFYMFEVYISSINRS